MGEKKKKEGSVEKKEEARERKEESHSKKEEKFETKKEEKVAEKAPGKEIIVYSAEWCPWCHKAIDYFAEKKISIEVRDVSKNPDYAKEVVEKSGQTGIPVITIGNDVIIGFNLPAIKKALGIE